MDTKRPNLSKIVEKLKKEFGEEVVVEKKMKPVESISTGNITIDYILGPGGFPRGRIIELFGEEGSGKSSLSLLTISNLVKSGGIAGYIDLENAVDMSYAQKLGVNIDNLLLVQPNSGDEGLSIAEKMVEEGVDLIVVDSVAAIVTKKELEGEIYDDRVATQARLMSQALRRLTAKVSKHNACVIFINQIRQMIGVTFGNPETTPGGKALKFYASVRLEVRGGKGGSRVKDDRGNTIGHIITVCAVKNKVALPYRKYNVMLIYERGIEDTESLIDILVNSGVISNPKQGTYILPNGKSFYGKNNIFEYVREHTQEVRNWLFAESLPTVVENKEDNLEQLEQPNN